MADASELANTLFPPPPPFYKDFTDANVARYTELKGESSFTSKSPALPLSQEAKVEWNDLESKLGRPRADWIVEEGRWMCFGQQYDVEPRIPSIEQVGLSKWIDPNEPPHISLPPLLHSFLHTFLLLLDTLTNTARNPGELEEKGWQHEGDQYIQHLSNLAATMMVSSNQLRDVQAEATLVLLMEKQLAARRQQTQELKEKSKNISEMLAKLRMTAAKAAGTDPGAVGAGAGAGGGDVRMATPSLS